MEDELIYDIKIYEWDKDSNRYSNRPRRINDSAYQYHIEWHREGIEFVQCPEGIIHHVDNRITDINVKSGIRVYWKELMRHEDSNEFFEFKPNADTPRYKIRVIKRTSSDWKDWCDKIPDNINTEVMWQLAEIEERKWSAQMPLNEIGSTSIELKSSLHPAINDPVRDLILATWQQRLEQRVVKAVLSDNPQSASEAVPHFKELVSREMMDTP